MSIRQSIRMFVIAGTGLLLAQTAVQAEKTASIVYDTRNPQMAFAVGDLTRALVQNGYRITNKTSSDCTITFEIFETGMGPQAFRIRREGQRGFRIVGGDATGAMYGGLEMAEQIRLGGSLDAITEKARKPYILRRGLKFNIPLDARSPSYDDTGTCAHMNIPVMWEWSFWKQFLETMVRNRYNVLSLWTDHPYPSIVRLPKYPDVNYDDVHVLKVPADPGSDRHGDRLDFLDPANTVCVKKISLDDKIEFWQKVFNYAEDLGIEIYVFHWNIYVFGAEGKYGITDKYNNPKTIAYMRYCITEFLKTYPQIDGIGISAGEHFGGCPNRENWIWDTYGLGVMDYHKINPDRQIRFIFRRLMANLDNITRAFKDYDAGPFETSQKYARARVHSTTTSPYLDMEYRQSLERNKIPCWLNLRNDDLFVLRWGDPDYVREFMANLPRDLMRWEAGYYMGPDGFVQGREFVAKDPDLAGQLEVDKHWYRFMMFGRLGYDLTLTNDFFIARLKERFPDLDADLLFNTMAASSKIIPQVNRFFFRVNDFQFSPEGCIFNKGFLTIDDSFFKYPPLRGSGILSVQQYADAIVNHKPFNGITPMEVADNLDRFANQTLQGVARLRQQASPQSKETQSVISDMEAMAELGQYYADKIRGAASLAIFRKDSNHKSAHKQAVKYLTDAISDWEAYARTASSQYRPQLLSRSHYLDWWKILEAVKKEAADVLNEGK